LDCSLLIAQTQRQSKYFYYRIDFTKPVKLIPKISRCCSQEFSSPVIAAGSSAKPKGLDPPELVCKDSDNNPVGLLLGIRCVVGSASDWIEQSTSLNQSDLSLGHVPSSGFGCVLSVGQTSKKFHRTIPGGFDTDAFADDFLDYEIYSQGDFIMGPPAFVPSLFSLFLEAAYLKTEIPVLEETKVDAATEIMSKDEKRLSVSLPCRIICLYLIHIICL
jgi:hypothetical protein